MELVTAVALEGMQEWSGPDLVSGEPDTVLVSIRGRDQDGSPMLLTVRHSEFQQIVAIARQQLRLDADQASQFAARLILHQMASRDESTPRDRTIHLDG